MPGECKHCGGSGLVCRSAGRSGAFRQQVCVCRFPWGHRPVHPAVSHALARLLDEDTRERDARRWEQSRGEVTP